MLCYAKEPAIAAVARALGCRALVPSRIAWHMGVPPGMLRYGLTLCEVPPRRALTLRLCGAWDDGLHTEV